MQSLLLWWNTSSSKRFLFSVICILYVLFHLPRCQLIGSRGGENYCCHIHLDAVIKYRTEMHRDGAVLTLPTLHISPFSRQHCPLLNMLWLSKACILTVGLLLPAVCPTALPPTCCTLITDCVKREINILCLIVCFIVVFLFPCLFVEAISL